MTTITLPSEIEEPLTKAALEQGTTPELLAVDYLRQRFLPPPSTEDKIAGKKTLFDSLAGFAGTIDGTSEALSENCGERFTEELLKKHQQRRL